jgi:alpha-tubulin suppressor-like RCC1 family protein
MVGQLWTWGKGQSGRLGHGDFYESSDAPSPMIVQHLKIFGVRVRLVGMELSV